MAIVAYEIPLSPQPQRFTLVSGDVAYVLLVQWCSPGGCWLLDIFDADNVALIQGMPLVTGADLLAQYRHLGFFGALVVQTDSDVDVVPGFLNLGITGHLYYVPDGQT